MHSFNTSQIKGVPLGYSLIYYQFYQAFNFNSISKLHHAACIVWLQRQLDREATGHGLKDLQGLYTLYSKTVKFNQLAAA